MPIPTSYTEDQLKAYMLAIVGGIGTALGMSASSFAEAVNDVLLAYGVNDISSASDIAKLRALAQVAAWETAVAQCAGQVSFDADNAKFSLSDLHKHALNNLTMAQAKASQYGGGWAGYAVTTGTIVIGDDPYPVTDDDSDLEEDAC